MACYLHAGCRKARVVDDAPTVQLAVVPMSDDDALLDRCNEQSIVVFQDIWRHKKRWQRIVHDPRAWITFDLYYCGIVVFDRKRAANHYVVNF